MALTLNSATSPSDVYVIDLAARSLTAGPAAKSAAWTPRSFVAPTLVRYPTFDQVDGQPRTIPAFYYRPAACRPGASCRW
jgi:hypothetical protein